MTMNVRTGMWRGVVLVVALVSVMWVAAGALAPAVVAAMPAGLRWVALGASVALSFATNRTNLQLRLDTQGPGASKGESIALKPQEGDSRRTGSFRAADMRSARPAPARSGADSEIDDVIER